MRNNAEGFEKEPEQKPIPYQMYMADWEEMHSIVGGLLMDGEPARNMLLGWIEAKMQAHGRLEPSKTREERREMSYAFRRVVGMCERTSLSNSEVKEKARAELAPILAKQKRESS